MSADPRVALKNLAPHLLPEFVQAEYPTFVAFVEAYYDYLDSQDVDMENIRDIDTTLDEYIKYFKAELAHNYPVVSTDTNTERFLLKHIKEQYLAKGSESSYKLLFRLLYGKDVFIDYPGRQMLRVSDGRWTQDVSIFVQVGQGDPTSLVGKTINIQTGKKIYNTNVISGVDAFSGVTASVQKVVVVNESLNIWEIFLDRNFYGDISPNNTVKYGSKFQATILPNTAKIKINDAGKGFRPGQVFQLTTGEGTPFWFKVATVTDSGGLKTIDIIKFGLFYNTSFSVTVLPTSAVTSKKKRTTVVSDLTYTVTSNGKVVDYKILNPGINYSQTPSIEITGNGTGATAHAVLVDGKISEIVIDNFGSGYTEVYAQVVNAPGDVTGSNGSVKPVIGSDYDYKFNDKSAGFTESGYVNLGDYWDAAEHGRFASVVIPQLRNNVITDINVTAQGSGYTTASVSISGGTGTTAHAVITNGHITGIVIDTFGHGYTNPVVTITGDGTGAQATAVLKNGCITEYTIQNGGSGYDLATPTVDVNYPQSNGVNIPHTAKALFKVDGITNGVITSLKVVHPGYGYLTPPILKVVGSYGYANGGYVGTIARQFFINAADTQGDNPAILNVSLDAVSKYPGYYKTNDGFLDDSMMIQDSYYFQAFAYVLKIDEQLQKYASVVRSMLHPSGMAMFGEYSINNKIQLSVGLTSLVKSLGVTIYDTVLADDSYLLDSNGNIIRGTYYTAYKSVEESYDSSTMAELRSYLFSKTAGIAMPWTANTNHIVDQFLYSGNLKYLVTVAGTTGSTAPTHTSGTASNGTVTLQYLGTDITVSATSGQYADFSSKLWTANTSVANKSVLYYQNRKYIVRAAGVTGLVGPTNSLSEQFNGTATLQYIGTDVTINTSNQTATYAGLIGDPKNSVYPTELFTKVFTKGIGATGQTESVFPIEVLTQKFTKSVTDTQSLTEAYTRFFTTKAFLDFAPIGETFAIKFTLNTIIDPLNSTFAESGYVVINPYDEGSYQAEQYANNRDSTFSHS